MSEYIFFWGTKGRFGFLSNWCESRFTLNGIEFLHAEQAMMYEKAKMMGDEEIAAEILEMENPSVVKKLGREVRNFDEKKWGSNRERIVTDILFAKFSQNALLKEKLESTGTAILVEASPWDRIWGIGLRASHPDAKIPEKWRGLNLLGKCLMEVRSRLR